MKGSHPEGPHGNLQQLFQPFLQFFGGFIGEGNDQKIPGLNLLFLDKIGCPIDDGAGFTRACPSQHQDRIFCIGNHLQLPVVQFPGKIGGYHLGDSHKDGFGFTSFQVSAGIALVRIVLFFRFKYEINDYISRFRKVYLGLSERMVSELIISVIDGLLRDELIIQNKE